MFVHKAIHLHAIAVICMILFLAGCSSSYNANDFIGKTSQEIMQEFGPFDCITKPADSDGLYRNCRCGYTIQGPRVGYLGTSDEILFFITFDDSGIAVSCNEAPRPGG